MTAGHLLWDPERGPAIMVTLRPDERVRQYSQQVRRCVAAACHANWVVGFQTGNDFGVVAVGEPFNAGVRLRSCHPNPGSSCAKNGVIIGYPSEISLSCGGRRLILTKGVIEYHESETTSKLEHEIDTEEGKYEWRFFLTF